MHALDREASYHNADLYAIWAAKPYFARAALAHASSTPGGLGLASAGHYKYVFWMDAGTFRREHVFRAWPDLRAVDAYWAAASAQSGTRPEDLVFIPLQIQPGSNSLHWTVADGPLDIDFAA